MKYKTIKISEELHKRLKKFCDENNLKLNKSCEMYLENVCLYAEEYTKFKSVEKEL